MYKTLILIFFTGIIYSQNVELDNTFLIGTGFNEIVNSISLANDEKLIVGGNFSTYNDINAKNVVRLNNDGTLDNTFNAGTGIPTGSFINKTFVQNDGKILVGGAFTSFNGVSKKNIVRLNFDGSIDSGFTPPNFSGGTINQGTIYDITIVNDKILIAGDFTSPKKYLTMLNMDGTIVSSFTPELPITDNGTNNGTYKIEVQNDNKIIVCRRKYVNRYNFDSTLDTSFPILESSTAGYPLLTCKLQSDGKILIAGRLDSFNNQATNQIIRINGDGTFDNTFNTGIGLSQTGQINCIGFTNDNKILIVGSFTSYNNNPTPGIARLLDNGSFDSTFNVGNGIGGLVKEVIVDNNEKILVGGSYVGYNNISSKNISRLVVNEDLGIVQNYYNDVLVYPNPTKDYIEVKNENSILQSYEIYNTDGKILDSKLTNSIVSKIDLSYYPTGFYILKLIFKNQTLNYRIIKK